MNANRDWQRARSRQRKEERRQAILDEAERLLREHPVAAINMADIATGAGVSKATLYLYFTTREALFVALTEAVLERWFAAVANALCRSMSDAALGRMLADELEREPVLPHLLSVLHTTLERNLEDVQVMRFKHLLKTRMADLGTRMDTACGWPPGTGMATLLRLHVCIIGVNHVSHPSAAVQRALEDDELAVFRLDFRPLLDDLLPRIVGPR